MRQPKGTEYIVRRAFKDINLEDVFFDSLRNDYAGFNDWFKKKANAGEFAFTTQYETGALQAFLYLKVENGPVQDVTPAITGNKVLKIGTFKINPHRTMLGQRFCKIIIDTALQHGCDLIYVTIFPKIKSLLNLFAQFGFLNHGIKESLGEMVLKKYFIFNYKLLGNENYPMVSLSGGRKYLLGIYPRWHTRLFPDSILTTESYNDIGDESQTNSISKVYLCAMQGIEKLRPCDLLIIYRTSENGKYAKYNSVATSLCRVIGLQHLDVYSSEDDFIQKILPLSVFSREELERLYRNRRYPYIIWFTYNAAFQRKITRAELLDDCGLNPDDYYGFMELSEAQFSSIIKAGGVHDRIIVN